MHLFRDTDLARKPFSGIATDALVFTPLLSWFFSYLHPTRHSCQHSERDGSTSDYSWSGSDRFSLTLHFTPWSIWQSLSTGWCSKPRAPGLGCLACLSLLSLQPHQMKNCERHMTQVGDKEHLFHYQLSFHSAIYPASHHLSSLCSIPFCLLHKGPEENVGSNIIISDNNELVGYSIHYTWRIPSILLLPCEDMVQRQSSPLWPLACAI